MKKPDRPPDLELDSWQFWFEEMVEHCRSCLPSKLIIVGELFYYKTPGGKTLFNKHQQNLQKEYKSWLIKKELKKCLTQQKQCGKLK